MEPHYQLPARLRYLCIGFQALAVLIGLLSLWLFFLGGIIDQSLDAYWHRLSPEVQPVVQIHALKKTLLSAIATVSYFAPVLILLGAFMTLGAFRRADPFSLTSAKSVRFLGLTIIAYAVSKIVTHAAVVLVLTYDNPPGQKEFSIAANTHTLVSLLIGVVILIIGHILTEASRLSDENGQFI